MDTFLFTWNPSKGRATDLPRIFKRFSRSQVANRVKDNNWSSAKRRDLPIGSRFFLIRIGKGLAASPPTRIKGIFGAGYTLTLPKKRYRNSSDLYCDIKFTEMFDPHGEKVFPLEELQNLLPLPHNWTPESSGVKIPESEASTLEKHWTNFYRGRRAPLQPLSRSIAPEDLNRTFNEGEKSPRSGQNYRRSKAARDACCLHFKFRCQVCWLKFDELYGKRGQDFIHVHHLNSIASRGGKKHSIHASKGLITVCPNCHAMLHRGSDQVTVVELRNEIKAGLISLSPTDRDGAIQKRFLSRP